MGEFDFLDEIEENVIIDEWETERLDGYKVKARKFSDNHPEYAGELHVFITNRKGKLLSEIQYTQTSSALVKAKGFIRLEKRGILYRKVKK